MNLLVVPKPLFNADMHVEGYYFSHQMGNVLIGGGVSTQHDRAAHSPLLELISKVGLEALTMQKIIFVPVTPILLMTDIETNCNENEYEHIVLLLDGGEIAIDKKILDRLAHFKELGFKIGFENITEANLENLKTALPFVDYIFSTLPKVPMGRLMSALRAHSMRIKIVAADLETSLMFQQMKILGVHLFDGSFYKLPTSSGETTIAPMKINYIQLLNTINSDDFELESFTKIVRQDASLTVQFVRLVNSSYSLSSEVKSLKQAAAILGQKEIKRWVTTAVTSSMGSDKPSEVTRLSMLRARFCENLAGLFDLGMYRDDLFLAGLFSVIDVVLDIPLDKALELIFLPDRVKNALVSGHGEIAEVMDFVKIYEQGNWHGVSRIALLRNLKINDIHEAYVSAVVWYSNLIREGLSQGGEG